MLAKDGMPVGYKYDGCLLDPAAAINDAYCCAFLITLVGHVGSLQRGSVHGFLAANSAIMLIFCDVGGDVNEA